jgi:hypothetical protein
VDLEKKVPAEAPVSGRSFLNHSGVNERDFPDERQSGWEGQVVKTLTFLEVIGKMTLYRDEIPKNH